MTFEVSCHRYLSAPPGRAAPLLPPLLGPRGERVVPAVNGPASFHDGIGDTGDVGPVWQHAMRRVPTNTRGTVNDERLMTNA